jgi:hypothetical protein
MKRTLATSLFALGAYSLTLLAGAPAASADAPSGVVSTPPSAMLSTTTAALADGDDIRARFIFQTTSDTISAATGATAAPEVTVLSPATAALADGDDIGFRAVVAVQH